MIAVVVSCISSCEKKSAKGVSPADNSQFVNITDVIPDVILRSVTSVPIISWGHALTAMRHLRRC